MSEQTRAARRDGTRMPPARRIHTWGLVSDIAVVTTVTALVLIHAYRTPSWWTDPLAEPPPREGTTLFLGVSLLWAAVLWAMSTPAMSVFSEGARGMRKAAAAGVATFGVVAFADLFHPGITLSRQTLASMAIPTLALVLWRWVRHRVLDHRMRATGESERILLVGSRRSCEDMATILGRRPLSGRTVAGACVTGDVDEGDLDSGIPVVGGIGRVRALVNEEGITTILLAPSHGLCPEEVRHLTWAIEGTGCLLMVSLGIEEVTGDRVHVGAVNHSPFAVIATAPSRGPARWAKRAIDVMVSGLILILLSPLLAVVAATIRLTSPGPAIFRQARVGRDGALFTMYKFRTMVADAEAQREELLARERDAGNHVMFKMTRDPRVTRIGALLRRTSMDELPQLFNILKGDMSLVGPRPSLASEVELYAPADHRRFRAQPGLTGLWQVSGRSELSWEESIRLDLRYVDNWTLAFDLRILARTIRAVLGGAGAH